MFRRCWRVQARAAEAVGVRRNHCRVYVVGMLGSKARGGVRSHEFRVVEIDSFTTMINLSQTPWNRSDNLACGRASYNVRPTLHVVDTKTDCMQLVLQFTPAAERSTSIAYTVA